MDINVEKLGELLAKMEEYKSKIDQNFNLAVRVQQRRAPDKYINPNRKPVPWNDYSFDALGLSRIIFGLPKTLILKNWNEVSSHYFGIPAGTRTFTYLWSSRWLMVKGDTYFPQDQYEDQMQRIKNVLDIASNPSPEHYESLVEKYCTMRVFEELGL